MTFQVADRVWDTTSTVGTGTITLANNAPNAYQAFSAVCSNGDIIHYTLAGRTANVWEVGLGTYNAAGPTLARTTILASSAGGAAVTLAGVTDVLGVWPAKELPSGVFNVKAFGAIGDGSTDDTAAINSAIAAFNTAGVGVLYFPATASGYKVTSALTTITASGTVSGDGSANRGDISLTTCSKIIFTPNNAVLFTTKTNYLQFSGLALVNSPVSNPASGCSAIVVTGINASQGDERVNFYDIYTLNFFDVIDVQSGQGWVMDACFISNPCHYGVRLRNVNSVDAGGWKVHNTTFVTNATGLVTPLVMMQLESGGGSEISNCNIVGGGNNFSHGIRVQPPVGVATINLFINNVTIETFTVNGITLDNTSGTWNNITIQGCEIGAFGTPTNGISVNANRVCISDIVFFQSVNFTGAPINMAGGSNVCVSNIYADTLKSIFGTPSSSPTVANDATGGIGGGQFFRYTEPSGIEQRLNWTAGASLIPEFRVTCPATNFVASLQAVNSSTQVMQMQMRGPAASTDPSAGTLNSDAKLILSSDNTVSSGGSDPISFRAGGSSSSAEVFQALSAGNLAMTNAANFTANTTSTATSLSSGSPGHANVQKWLTITDGSATFYIPCF